MKYKVCGLAVLLTALIGAESVSSNEPNFGLVRIYDKEQERTCALAPIPGANEVYRFGSDKTCKQLPNDEAYYFKFDGLPSAVLVTFYDDPDCKFDTGNFVFQLRTLQNDVTTEPMKLSTVHAQPEGNIIAVGVRLERKSGSGQVDGKLSCVRIEY
ncbi:hypothetical protein [Pseudomonas mosselii]|uniref:Uncharacterized protein n=1 Tax=Pseudomonas mosselii TaxID=78327 RepID=A0A7W2Q1H0_9PSED|nr:hypothetical protein [Pseudomonas mosselii]MBA6068677.1 hypothetical protein [Pseudomonas mosselii]